MISYKSVNRIQEEEEKKTEKDGKKEEKLKTSNITYITRVK